jgi:predicted metal-binding protein
MKEFDYIGGQPSQPPFNNGAISIELNWDKDNIDLDSSQVKGKFTTNTLRFTGAEAKKIYDWERNGNVTQGLEYKKLIKRRVNGVDTFYTLFNHYIDLMTPTDFNCNDIEVVVKEKNNIDWMNDTSDGISFEFLWELGLTNPTARGAITENDIVYIPYCKSINTSEAIFTFVACLSFVYQIVNEFNTITGKAFESANPMQAATIAALGFHILYFTILIAMTIKTFITLIAIVVQPVKYHSAMYVRKLFERCCDYFGFTFDSDIFEQNTDLRNLVLMPEKRQLAIITTDNDTLSFLSAIGLSGVSTGIKFVQNGFTTKDTKLQKGYYKATAGEFIRDMKDLFNARVVIQNGVFHFLRWDKNPKGFNLSTAFTVPDIVPDDMDEIYQLNTPEYRANFLLEFKTDITDNNTIKNYKGTGYQVLVKTHDRTIPLDKGLYRQQFNFALATRKTELNVAENIINVCVKVIDAFVILAKIVINAAILVANAVILLYNTIVGFFDTLINIINGAAKLLGIDELIKLDFGKFKLEYLSFIPFEGLGIEIDDRIGMLQLEKDEFETPKLFLVEPDTLKLPANHREKFSAKYLWDNYHFINTFVPVKGKHNQWKMVVVDKCPFTFDDFKDVKDNNTCNAPLRLATPGALVRIKSLQWNWHETTAKIHYEINEENKNLTKNLSITTYEPDGN